MTKNAATLLQELRDDHRNMGTLLDLLHAEIDRIAQDEDVEFELLDDVMRYMVVYSDAIHHPREDLIYAALRRDHPALAEGLERVEADHREIAELGGTLRAEVEAVIAGAAVSRERVIEDARAYMHRLRRHMAWEEEDLFRRADSEADSLAVDASHLTASDPVFGLQREASFANLFEAIRHEAGQAHSEGL